jgi:hypothetical protein
MRVTGAMVLSSASDHGRERGLVRLETGCAANSSGKDVETLCITRQLPGERTYRDMRAKSSPADPGISS